MAKKAPAKKAATKKAVEVKVEAPVVEAPVVETPVVEEAPVVEETVVEAPVVEVKEEVKKAPAKKAPAKKAAAKAETVITLEFGEYTAVMSSVEERVKAQVVADGVKASAIKSLNIYVKPFENAAYYVVNGDITGRVDLF